MLDAETTGSVGDWHELLLRVAGWIPDDLICEARSWLADGQTVDVAQAVALAANMERLQLSPEDRELIRAELEAVGEDLDVVDGFELCDRELSVPGPWCFHPAFQVDRDADAAMPTMMDLTGSDTDPGLMDEIDRAAGKAVALEPETVALWRAWRWPVDGMLDLPAVRVFVVAVSHLDPAELPGLTRRLQEVLIEMGERNPQVEVCLDDRSPPRYQLLACAHSALLWAREPAVPIRLARVFDAVDPQLGPMFTENHPVIDDLDEVERLLDYLDGAMPVLSTDDTMVDIFDPGQADVVPLTFRTDGTWIWTDTVSYYLEHYSLAPDTELLAHLQACVGYPPAVTDVGLHRVASFLQRPGDELVWVPEVGDTTSYLAR